MDIFGKIAVASRFLLKFCSRSKNGFSKCTCKATARSLHGACYDHGSMMPTKRFP